jgi:hypothetical protein
VPPAPAQRLGLFKALRHVAEDGGDPCHAAALLVKCENGELDRDARAILAQCRDGQDIAASVADLAGAHRLVESGPVPRPQILRDDEIERASERLGFRKAEDTFGPLVPEADRPLRVGIDDRVRRLAREGLAEVSDVDVHAGTPA